MPAARAKASDLELKILTLLWNDGPQTAREILTALPDRKPRAYTSVLSVMQVMEKKGLLTREREGLADRWAPALSREQVMGPFLKNILAHLFSGRPSAVLQQLLRAEPVDSDEIESIKKVIREYEKRPRPSARKEQASK